MLPETDTLILSGDITMDEVKVLYCTVTQRRRRSRLNLSGRPPYPNAVN